MDLSYICHLYFTFYAVVFEFGKHVILSVNNKKWAQVETKSKLKIFCQNLKYPFIEENRFNILLNIHVKSK